MQTPNQESTIPSAFVAESSVLPRTSEELVNCHALKHNLKYVGVELFRTIQCTAIASFRQGSDLVLYSEASTGKTLCFMAPLIDKLLQGVDTNNHSLTMGYSAGIEAEFQIQRTEHEQRRCILPRVLLLVPTHELGGRAVPFCGSIMRKHQSYSGNPPLEAGIRFNKHLWPIMPQTL